MEILGEQVHLDLMLTRQEPPAAAQAVAEVQQGQQEALADQAEQVQSQDHQLHMPAAAVAPEIKTDLVADLVAQVAAATALAVTQDLRVVEQQTVVAVAVEDVAL